nr:MAG TPA: hypothetical protein [Crassvirales sp.]
MVLLEILIVTEDTEVLLIFKVLKDNVIRFLVCVENCII